MSEQATEPKREEQSSSAPAGAQGGGQRSEGQRSDGPRGDRRPMRPGGDKRFVFRRKECYFTKNNITYIDYKDVELLRRFIGKNGAILPRRFTGTTPKNQRKLAIAIKRARAMALLPITGEVDRVVRRDRDRDHYNRDREREPRENTEAKAATPAPAETQAAPAAEVKAPEASAPAQETAAPAVETAAAAPAEEAKKEESNE